MEKYLLLALGQETNVESRPCSPCERIVRCIFLFGVLLVSIENDYRLVCKGMRHEMTPLKLLGACIMYLAFNCMLWIARK